MSLGGYAAIVGNRYNIQRNRSECLCPGEASDGDHRTPWNQTSVALEGECQRIICCRYRCALTDGFDAEGRYNHFDGLAAVSHAIPVSGVCRHGASGGSSILLSHNFCCLTLVLKLCRLCKTVNKREDHGI